MNGLTRITINLILAAAFVVSAGCVSRAAENEPVSAKLKWTLDLPKNIRYIDSWDVSISFDGKTMAAIITLDDADGHESIGWNLETGEKTFETTQSTENYQYQMSPDGNYFDRSGKPFERYNIRSGEEIEMPEDFEFMEYSPDGLTLYSPGMTAWDRAGHKRLQSKSNERAEKYFSVPSRYQHSDNKEGTGLIVTDTLKNKVKLRLDTTDLRTWYFSPDRHLLLTCNKAETELTFWDIGTGEKKFSIKGEGKYTGHDAPHFEWQFSPDSKTIEVADQYNIGRGWLTRTSLWSLETGQELFAFPQNSPFHGFLPDGRSAVVSPNENNPTTEIWDVLKGEKIASLPSTSRDIWYSKDGKTMVMGDGKKLNVYELAGSGPAADTILVSNVSFLQRDRERKVDIYYDLSDEADVLVKLTPVDNDAPELYLTGLSGDKGEKVAAGTKKHIVWNAGGDFWKGVKGGFVVTVFARNRQAVAENGGILKTGFGISQPADLDLSFNTGYVIAWAIAGLAGLALFVLAGIAVWRRLPAIFALAASLPGISFVIAKLKGSGSKVKTFLAYFIGCAAGVLAALPAGLFLKSPASATVAILCFILVYYLVLFKFGQLKNVVRALLFALGVVALGALINKGECPPGLAVWIILALPGLADKNYIKMVIDPVTASLVLLLINKFVPDSYEHQWLLPAIGVAAVGIALFLVNSFRFMDGKSGTVSNVLGVLKNKLYAMFRPAPATEEKIPAAANPRQERAPRRTPSAAETVLGDAAPGSDPSTYLSDKYEILRELGRGGMGIVYEARHKTLGKKFAIKKMRDEMALNPREKKRFLDEAKRVAELHHPNITDIYDIYQEKEIIYLVFEYVEGRTIEAILDKESKFALQRAVNTAAGICDALGYAHSKKIIHRDIKPSNIMLNGDDFVKVMDFGIAREAKDTLSRLTGMETSGTFAYMAPEQHLGRFDTRTDIYALGSTLFEMLTGEPPFMGPDFLAQKREMAYKNPREIDSSIPEKLEQIIVRCLQADSAKRFQSAGELGEILKRPYTE